MTQKSPEHKRSNSTVNKTQSLFANHTLATEDILAMAQEATVEEQQWYDPESAMKNNYLPSINDKFLKIIDYQVTALCPD